MGDRFNGAPARTRRSSALEGNPHYALLGVDGYWRFSQERAQQMGKDGRIAIPVGGTVPRYKISR